MAMVLPRGRCAGGFLPISFLPPSSSVDLLFLSTSLSTRRHSQADRTRRRSTGRPAARGWWPPPATMADRRGRGRRPNPTMGSDRASTIPGDPRRALLHRGCPRQFSAAAPLLLHGEMTNVISIAEDARHTASCLMLVGMVDVIFLMSIGRSREVDSAAALNETLPRCKCTVDVLVIALVCLMRMNLRFSHLHVSIYLEQEGSSMLINFVSAICASLCLLQTCKIWIFYTVCVRFAGLSTWTNKCKNKPVF